MHNEWSSLPIMIIIIIVVVVVAIIMNIIPAHARTAHKGLLQKRLEEDLC